MADDRFTNMPLTETQQIEEEIIYHFESNRDPALTTSEICSEVNSKEEKITNVLIKLDNQSVLEQKQVAGERVWWLTD